jgi:hypothetical protein
MKRYFFVSLAKTTGFCNFDIITNGNFLNSEQIRQFASDNLGLNHNDYVLLSIFEFKSKSDYDDFKKPLAINH